MDWRIVDLRAHHTACSCVTRVNDALVQAELRLTDGNYVNLERGAADTQLREEKDGQNRTYNIPCSPRLLDFVDKLKRVPLEMNYAENTPNILDQRPFRADRYEYSWFDIDHHSERVTIRART